MLSDKRKISTMLIFSAFCALYYTFTIPSNSIWIDQVRIINVTKEILEGNFPLVGILHSNRMHSFPAFYYFITPLVYISENPLFLYWSVALFYISGVLFVANYIFNKFGYFESNIFLLFSATHVSTLFFSSFLWNPNYIPFFMSLFFVLLFKYLDGKTSVIYFHIVGIIINIIVQMMPQLIVLIPSFIFILFLFRKMPSMVNQVVHIFIQVALVYPWIHFHLFIFEWNNFESAQKLYKGFTIAIIQYINYLGGWGLNSEYTTYLAYGTNTYPYTKLIDILLTGSSIILLILITYSTYLSLRSIKINNYINFHIIETNDYEITTKKCLIVLTVINLSCIWFFLTGIHLMSHHYQFLAPLLALNMSLLVSYEKKYKKLLVSVLMLFILFTLLLYPPFWLNPLLFFSAINHMASYFNDVCTNTLGSCMHPKDLPATYIPIWLSVKLPLFIIIGIFLVPFTERKIFINSRRNIFFGTILSNTSSNGFNGIFLVKCFPLPGSD